MKMHGCADGEPWMRRKKKKEAPKREAVGWESRAKRVKSQHRGYQREQRKRRDRREKQREGHRKGLKAPRAQRREREMWRAFSRRGRRTCWSSRIGCRRVGEHESTWGGGVDSSAAGMGGWGERPSGLKVFWRSRTVFELRQRGFVAVPGGGEGQRCPVENPLDEAERPIWRSLWRTTPSSWTGSPGGPS